MKFNTLVYNILHDSYVAGERMKLNLFTFCVTVLLLKRHFVTLKASYNWTLL